ncbi:MAG: NAD(P)/FAD-dependent oxidoreductase [Myxococcales bacterium]|nr:NAD(P)/FAD-dependent oxidoreductase [Myxococcales bacterium]
MSRDALPWSKHLPDGSERTDAFDAIVIGSGMGGMTAAALLAKLGQRVLVVEQHYVAGGFTHAFRRPGYEWDVGVHAVGEVTEHTLTGRLLSKLTDGRLQWASLGESYDEFTYPDGMRIAFPDSPAQFRENLIDAFPREQKAIDEYLHLVRAVSKTMRGYYLSRLAPRVAAPVLDRTLAKPAQRWLEMRTKDVVDGLTDDPRLRAVFTAQWGYYGSVPSRSSFAMQALVVKHFLHGAYYPVGGSKRIAVELLQTVANAGGWTTIRADVDQILVEGGRAAGVRLKDGREARAKKVVSAVGVRSTAEHLLPPEIAKDAWATSVSTLEPSPAHVCLYLGFEGDVAAAGATAANQWFYETYDMEVPAWDVRADGVRGEAPCLYCSFPSLKDPEHDAGPERRHTGEVVTFVPWETFAPFKDARWHKRGDAYEALKTELHDKLLEHFGKRMPGLAPLVKYAELSTPASTHHFVRPTHGAIYGLEPTPTRFRNAWLRPRAPLSGLFFAGSEVATVGVIGAMMGGVLGAAAAEPLRVVDYVRKMSDRQR